MSLGALKLGQRFNDVHLKFVGGAGLPVGEFALRVIPNSFIRVQFRRIGRETLDSETWVMFQQVSNKRPLVSFRVVPEQDHTAAQVPENLMKKGKYLVACDIGLMACEVKPEAMARGTDRNS